MRKLCIFFVLIVSCFGFGQSKKVKDCTYLCRKCAKEYYIENIKKCPDFCNHLKGMEYNYCIGKCYEVSKRDSIIFQDVCMDYCKNNFEARNEEKFNPTIYSIIRGINE